MQIVRSVIRAIDKYQWEFDWQRDQWLSLWKQPEIQQRCRDYWCDYRHLDDILRLLPMSDSSAILDVGCGLSSVLHYLPGRRTGIDPLGERYKRIYQYPFPVIKGKGEKLPFTAGCFDYVFCSNAIDHASKPSRVISEVYRVLRPHSHFILTCEVFPLDIGKRNAGHPHSMTEASLLALVHPWFETVAHWKSPWLGMRLYVLGQPGSGERFEHVLVLKRRPTVERVYQRS